MGAFLFLILIIAGIIGVSLYFKGFKTPPSSMSEENKQKFNSDTGLGAYIGIFIVCVVLAILGF